MEDCDGGRITEMVRFVLDDDKVYKVVAESEDAIWVVDYDNPCAPKMVKQDGIYQQKAS